MYDIPANYPHTAQKKYLLRRSYCHHGMFRSQAAVEYINEKLKATWSPEQIACTPCGLKMPSWRTIYRWIYEKYLVKRSPATGERNLRTGAKSSSGLAAKCILPIRTVRGKRARMKMQTACFERFIRKRNLSRVAPAALKRNLALMNARPRKVLNFRSAQDLWDFELASCCT